MPDGEIAGVGDEAHFMGFVVQGCSTFDEGAAGQGDDGMEDDFFKIAAAVGSFYHDSPGMVLVVYHYDIVDGAKVQVPEHVTGRDGGQEEFFGVVSRWGSPEGGVGGAGNVGFAFDLDDMVPVVGSVVGCTGAFIARPYKRGAVVMFFFHQCSFSCSFSIAG